MSKMKGDILGGRYRLNNRLAEGGMGEVWRAHDQLLQRDVAVKLLRGTLSAEPNVVERFRREARAAASLSHNNMANVFDYVEEGEEQGIVMELVSGETLADRIAREAPMRFDDSVQIIDQVLDALGAAHAAGIIHRDMKPGNVMIDATGQVKVADFGIARALGDATLTETGSIMGSVHYLAPEQLRGATVPASDLYSVGAILYEMLTAHKLFEGGTPVEIAMRRLSVDAPRPSVWRADIPPAIEAVIVRALNRDPGMRFATTTQMRAALSGQAQSTVASAADQTMLMPAEGATPTIALGRPAMPPPKPLWGFSMRRPVLIAAAIAALMLGVIVFAVTRPPEKVTVPTFTGLTLTQAHDLAAQDHITLDMKASAYSKTAPKDTIISQAIRPGAVISPGTTIGLVVSKGPPPCCTVPKLSGLTPAAAKVDLVAAGLVLGPTTCQSDENATGLIVRQSPGPSTSAAPKSTVSIVISGCPQSSNRKGHKGKGHD